MMRNHGFFYFLPCRLQQGAREKILRKQNNVEAVPKVGSKDLHCKSFLDETWIAN